MRCSQPRADLASAALLAVSILYPILTIVSVRLLGPYPVLALLAGLLILRLTLPASHAMPAGLLWTTVLIAGVVVALALFNADLAVRIYPAAMNFALLIAFASSLWQRTSMIERFARLAEPDLDAGGVRYTRNVTWVWACFFLANGSVALWLALFGSWNAWAMYTGLISYILLGMLFAVEYAIRRRLRRSQAVPG